jgi:hypothetical protein
VLHPQVEAVFAGVPVEGQRGRAELIHAERLTTKYKKGIKGRGQATY